MLTDSGQTHQLYRGVVNHDVRDTVVVTLEAERIEYRPAELASRMLLCRHLIAATGKPALSDLPSTRMWSAVVEHWDILGDPMMETWTQVYGQPLSRLAAWLSPNKETCRNEFPSPAAFAQGEREFGSPSHK